MLFLVLLYVTLFNLRKAPLTLTSVALQGKGGESDVCLYHCMPLV